MIPMWSLPTPKVVSSLLLENFTVVSDPHQDTDEESYHDAEGARSDEVKPLQQSKVDHRD